LNVLVAGNLGAQDTDEIIEKCVKSHLLKTPQLATPDMCLLVAEFILKQIAAMKAMKAVLKQSALGAYTDSALRKEMFPYRNFWQAWHDYGFNRAVKLKFIMWNPCGVNAGTRNYGNLDMNVDTEYWSAKLPCL